VRFRKGLFAGIAAGLAAAGIAGYVLAQVTLPLVVSLGQTDVVHVLPQAQPVIGNVYAPVGMVGSVTTNSYVVPLTAFTITPANGVSFLLLNPAGTLATGTLTLPAQPSDGQWFCLFDTHTQTAITIQGNTGQTLAGVTTPTALVANQLYCWKYFAAQATWYETQ
jgi:hypothetical protein